MHLEESGNNQGEATRSQRPLTLVTQKKTCIARSSEVACVVSPPTVSLIASDYGTGINAFPA